ncbi:MAG TPA: DUF262 domain-containing protein [Candidatus Limnocylindria bacterium]|nr:DUF262 domain-containing protein [Candidatus Limnocylindria bacterium]
MLAPDFTVAKANAWRSSIDDDPPYQREGSVWSLDKQQLFIDSLLNGYDVPKIYLHDLRGKHPNKVYAVVDGKQRLSTIWRFLADEFALADDFRIEPANVPDDLPPGAVAPQAGQVFSQLHRSWRDELLNTYLAVVLIKNASVEDIEDLFSRLNNGEPLNAAEKRNAMGGAVTAMLRELVRHPFFADRLAFSNGRYQHLDLAARLLVIEDGQRDAPQLVPDLKSRSLDAFVKANRRLQPAEQAALRRRLEPWLDFLSSVFAAADPLLAAPSQPALYYLFAKSVAGDDASPALAGRIRAFLESFHESRRAALERPDGQQDATMIEFTHLMQHGTNDQRSLERRLAILIAEWESRQPNGSAPNTNTLQE